ncbi:MAG: hypothetical protein ACFHWX_13930 [Bacteroidota bacterium]
MTEANDFWIDIVQMAGIAGLSIAVLILVIYNLRSITLSKRTKRHDFIGKYEIKWYKTANTIFSFGLAFFLFDGLASILGSVRLYEFVYVGFISGAISFAIGYGIHQYLKFYYPFNLEKKMSRIRFKKKVSPKSGNEMVVLTEKEEDVHLTQEMMDHETNHVYDYDVWIDEATGYKEIERYDGQLQALICPKCNFRTLKEYKEELEQSPGYRTEGLLKKYYACSYCEHQESREFSIASIEEEQEMEG